MLFDTIRTVALYATVPMILMEFVRVYVPEGVTRDGRVLWNMPSVVLIASIESALAVIFADAAYLALHHAQPVWTALSFGVLAAFWASRALSELFRTHPTPQK